jgi:hypothetical protein
MLNTFSNVNQKMLDEVEELLSFRGASSTSETKDV